MVGMHGWSKITGIEMEKMGRDGSQGKAQGALVNFRRGG